MIANLLQRLLGCRLADLGLGERPDPPLPERPLMIRSARDEARACASVLATMKSTRDRPEAIRAFSNCQPRRQRGTNCVRTRMRGLRNAQLAEPAAERVNMTSPGGGGSSDGSRRAVAAQPGSGCEKGFRETTDPHGRRWSQSLWRRRQKIFVRIA